MSRALADHRLPPGFTVRLCPDTRSCDGGRTLMGGSSDRIVFLRPAAADAVSKTGEVVVADPVSSALARLLLDRGLAHPWWRVALSDEQVHDVTVVIPVKDRVEQLRRLLDGLPKTLPVVVVDDGSGDAATTARVAHQFDARIVRHPASRGPAAARNTGLGKVSTPFVVFVDSDVVPVAGWLAGLRRHFEDPSVGIVGPRVLGLEAAAGDSWLSRYEAARSSLDLGPLPGVVRPHGRVAYLPSAALMARCLAVADGFDDDMQVAEDVDLIWRTQRSGWLVRYDPSCVVRHEHRTETAQWLRRKVFYGTGASLLAERHGSAVSPMTLTPWTALLAVTLLAQRRWSLPLAGAVCGFVTARISSRLTRSGHPVRAAATLTAIGAGATLRQTMSAMSRHYWPLAVLAAARGKRARRALLVAALADGLVDYRRTRPALDPVRFLVARRLDDLGYGAGLWLGALRNRSGRALMPTLRGFRPHVSAKQTWPVRFPARSTDDQRGQS